MFNNKKFLWGVVNIGQQTEGSDNSSNWSCWANRGLVPDMKIGKSSCTDTEKTLSTTSCNNYWNAYKIDHQAVEDLGCNSMRITIEWSRLEPREGYFDKEAVKHYQKIIGDLKKRNISVVVGLWHWSVPMWFENKYGMHNRNCPDLFLKFVKFVRDNFGDLIDVAVVLNEPTVYLLTGYLRGNRPPFIKSYWRAWRVLNNLVKMHRRTYTLWKEKFPETQIGSTYLWNYDKGRDASIFQKTFLWLRDFWQNKYILSRLRKYSDYIGVNYYTSNSFYFGKSDGLLGFHGTNNWQSPTLWKQFPKGLYYVLKQVSKFKKPIFILENGKPTNSGINDVNRQKFLKMSVKYMQRAMNEGVDVRGYFYYSLCDSYEWDSGYDFKFGLIEIDRSTGQRTRRKSFETYREIVEEFLHKNS